MRPVGPESAETYWMRRALVVGGFLVLLIILLIVLFNLGGSPGQAAPAPAQTGIPVSAPPSATPTVQTASPSAPTASPTGSARPSQSPSPSESPTPSQSPTPSHSPSRSASSSPSPSSTTGKSASSKPTDKPATPAVTACTADDLKSTIKSKGHDVKIGAKVTFDVTYTNSSKQSCTVSVSPDTYQLTIYSGTDRIWSTEDCVRLVRSAKVTLKPGHAVGWSITWNGKRSQQGATCQNRPETPQAGYYHATSQLKGTAAAGYLLVLH